MFTKTYYDANPSVTSNREQTHAPYQLGRATGDGQILLLLQPIKKDLFGKDLFKLLLKIFWGQGHFNIPKLLYFYGSLPDPFQFQQSQESLYMPILCRKFYSRGLFKRDYLENEARVRMNSLLSPFTQPCSCTHICPQFSAPLRHL